MGSSTIRLTQEDSMIYLFPLNCLGLSGMQKSPYKNLSTNLRLLGVFLASQQEHNIMKLVASSGVVASERPLLHMRDLDLFSYMSWLGRD